MTIVMWVCMAIHFSSPDALRICAQAQAERFVSVSGVNRTVTVEIVEDARHFAQYGRDVMAYVIANPMQGCVIRMRPAAAADARYIAHECAHCLLDWDVMTSHGLRVDAAEHARREKRADECADRLMGAGQ